MSFIDYDGTQFGCVNILRHGHCSTKFHERLYTFLESSSLSVSNIAQAYSRDTEFLETFHLAFHQIHKRRNDHNMACAVASRRKPKAKID